MRQRSGQDRETQTCATEPRRSSVNHTAQDRGALAALQRMAHASPAAANLRQLQAPAGAAPLQFGRNKKPKLVTISGEKYKKKEKERKESKRVDEALDEQLTRWIDGYGHAEERHVGMSDTNLDQRGKPLATTFETRGDLFKAAKDVITVNEQKINHWFTNTDEDRLELWSHRDDSAMVRGRRRQARPDWHQYRNPPPPHQRYVTVGPDDLPYIIAVFDRDHWSGNPKGLVTCYPSLTK